MTPAQEKKMATISPVLNHFENGSGQLVIDTTYGSNYFQRLFIGPRGGFASASIIYANYDFEDRRPFHKLFTEQGY